jgi:hypothetical protein
LGDELAHGAAEPDGARREHRRDDAAKEQRRPKQ